jgi:hypothetical protein
MLTRKLLALVMASLITSSGWAAPSGIGTVKGGVAATVRGTSLVAGTTLFSGDMIEVGANGNARIAFASGSQLTLAANSKAQLLTSPAAGVQVNVKQGLAKFRNSDKSPVEAILGDATVKMASAEGVGYVNVYSPTAAVIGAEKGGVVVKSADGTSTTVPEGMALTVKLQSQPASAGNSSGAGKKVLIGLIIVGATVAAAVAANQSENSQNPSLSPFRPN